MKEIELIEKRKPREKHFLQENGTIKAILYDKDIHYLKNGSYEEIDNQLIKEGKYYVNKNNSFKAYFKENIKNELMRLEKSNDYLNIKLSNAKSGITKNIDKTLDSVESIKYENVFDDVDLDYKLLSNTIKESIIIKNKENIPNELSFEIDTNLLLTLNNDGSISATKKGKLIFTITAPYMLDANNIKNENIFYELLQKDNKYKIDLKLDLEWLNNPAISYPVIIDPTIIDDDQTINIWDTYIYPGDTYINRGSQEILKAGVERVDGYDTINRTLIQFNLPEIGTGSQIIDARLYLTGYLAPANTYDNDIVEVHRITENWNENDANWSNMNNKYDERIETCFYSQRSFLYVDDTVSLRESYANITDLVKKWYTDTPNFGIMLKQSEEVYNKEYYPAFFSRNNSIMGANPKPVFQVTYRNQNGLEDYMKYIPLGFAYGTASVNPYNGNLVSKFDIASTIGGKLPASLKIIYNTNDVILKNGIRYGLGWRLNLSQTIESETISGITYLKYSDEDGTIHYFQSTKEALDENGNIITSSESNTYYDEDGMEMKIIDNGNYYELYDKENNMLEFKKVSNIGRLVRITDNSSNEIQITYNSNNAITKVTDANQLEINITYSSNLITVTNSEYSATLSYSDNKLISISNKSGTTQFEYNDNNIISKIIDISGKYITYEYYTNAPYKVKKVIEYGIDNTIGEYYTIIYNSSSTTIIDNKNKLTTLTFNDYGNVCSISNLKSNTFVSDALGLSEQYGTNYQDKNKLLFSGNPISYVKNHLTNSSFESNSIDFSSKSSTLSISTDFSFSGSKSLKIVNSIPNSLTSREVNVEKDNYYTLSGYLKNTNNVVLYLSYTDVNGIIVCETSQVINSIDDFERNDVTIFYPPNATSNLIVGVKSLTTGTCYVDDIQLEKGEVVNNYNYIENSDFSDGLAGWNTSAYKIVDNQIVNVDNRFEVVTLQDNSKALKILMSPTCHTGLLKNYELTGQQGDNYTISFWYKNEGITDSTGETHNSVIINFEYEYGQSSIPSQSLNPCRNEWQLFSYTFHAEHNYNSLSVALFQDLNANNLYITNVSLFKNIRQSCFSRDKNGNVISIKGYDDKITQFKYNKNNQITKMLNPKLNSLCLEYDKCIDNRAISGMSNNGVLDAVKYDEHGNIITMKKKFVGNTSIIQNGLYKIRILGTEKYMKRNYNDELQFNNKNDYKLFKFIKEGNYYKIEFPLLVNKYLTIDGNNIILKEYNSNMSLFELARQEDYGFTIKCIGNSKYLKNVNDKLTFDVLESNNNDFIFVIESVEYKDFIENNIEYDNTTDIINKTIDSNLMVTQYDINNNSGLLNRKNVSNVNEINYYYNNKDQVTQTKFDGISNSYVYNTNSLLQKIIGGNNEYTFEYDSFFKLKKIKLNNNLLITNMYEVNNGNLLNKTYSNNQSISYSYDSFDRIKKIIMQDDEYNYKYDCNGELAKIVSNDSIVKFNYDLSKRLKKYTYNDFKTEYGYDENGNISSKKIKYFDDINYSIDNIYNNDDDVIKTIFEPNIELSYEYDKLSRIIKKKINNNDLEEYEYVTNGHRTTPLIKTVKLGSKIISHKFDKLSNITATYCNGKLTNKYYYDNHNQLIREDNLNRNETIRFKYDNNGNILSKKAYELNSFNLISSQKYKYEDDTFGDRLTNYNDEIITYDNYGNPVSIGNKILTWKNGNELNTYADDSNVVSFKYNDNKIRVSKTVNNVQTKYAVEGEKIILEKTGNNVLYYMYDTFGELIAFKYNNNVYYYQKNLQGDIIGIMDSNMNLIAQYDYDSYGNILSIKDGQGNDISTLPNNIANINPFRYRSYYYDKETRLYYLNSRYYNPLWARFISCDDLEILFDIQESPIQYNLYTYCLNEPVNGFDENGTKKLPRWANIAIGVGTIGVLGVATALTGGTAGVILGSALVGATHFGVAGIAVGTIYGGIKGGTKGAIDGACSGFMYGTLAGAAAGAAAGGIKVVTGVTKIIANKPHGTALHNLSINWNAGKMLLTHNYEKIGINRALKKLGLIGSRKPDVVAIGTNKLASKIVEVVSPSQTIAQITSKVTKMVSENTNTIGKVVSWVQKFGRLTKDLFK